MSNIKIYSKAAFAIGEGATRNGDIDQFVTVPRSFQDMPEKYITDATYLAAVKAGMIIPYTSTPAVSVVEENAAEEFGSKESVDDFKNELKAMNHAQVKELAEKYNAEFVESDKLSENKKRVFEAYKLTLDSKR